MINRYSTRSNPINNPRINKSNGYGPWSDCWQWRGPLGKNGYPEANKRINGRSEHIWRAIFISVNGPIPDGYEINHLCNVHDCVRPSHMELVTHQGNIAYREIINRLGFVPQPYKLEQAVHNHSLIEQQERANKYKRAQEEYKWPGGYGDH